MVADQFAQAQLRLVDQHRLSKQPWLLFSEGAGSALCQSIQKSRGSRLPSIVFVAAVSILQEGRRRYEECERKRREEEVRRYDERQQLLWERNSLRGFQEMTVELTCFITTAPVQPSIG